MDELQPSSEIARELPVLTVNDITVEITSARVTQFNREVYAETGEETYTYQLVGNALTYGIEVGICYTALDDGEWRARVGQLIYGENAIYADSSVNSRPECTRDIHPKCATGIRPYCTTLPG